MSRISARKALEDVVNQQANIIKELTQKSNELEQEVGNYKISEKIKHKYVEENKPKPKTKYFFKTFFNNFNNIILSKQLTRLEIAIIFICANFLEKETNIVKNSKGDRATEQDLIELIGTNRNNFDSAIKSLTEKEIMFKIQKSGNLVNFIMSPKFFFIGQDDSTCFQDIYDLLKSTKTYEND